MELPQIMRQTDIAKVTVSTIFIPVGDGGYYETMLFLNGNEVDGLKDYTTYSLFDDWEENHKALCRKATTVQAYGPM